MFFWNKLKCFYIALCKSKELKLLYLNTICCLSETGSVLNIWMEHKLLRCVKKDQASFGTLTPTCSWGQGWAWAGTGLVQVGRDYASPDWSWKVLMPPTKVRRPQVYPEAPEAPGSCQYPQTHLPPQQWQQEHHSTHKQKAGINPLSTVVSL